MKMTIPMMAALLAFACAAAAPNTLTEAEKADGWQLLWDGKTLDGWVGEKGGCKAPPSKGWEIKDGILTVLPTSRIVNGKWEKLPKEVAALGGGGDLVTKESFKDFDLKLDFRLTACANSGIKYFYDRDRFGGTCEEYQLPRQRRRRRQAPRRMEHGPHRLQGQPRRTLAQRQEGARIRTRLGRVPQDCRRIQVQGQRKEREEESRALGRESRGQDQAAGSRRFDGEFPQHQNQETLSKKRTPALQPTSFEWQSQGESNSSYRHEKPVS